MSTFELLADSLACQQGQPFQRPLLQAQHKQSLNPVLRTMACMSRISLFYSFTS